MSIEHLGHANASSCRKAWGCPLLLLPQYYKSEPSSQRSQILHKVHNVGLQRFFLSHIVGPPHLTPSPNGVEETLARAAETQPFFSHVQSLFYKLLYNFCQLPEAIA